MMNLSGFCDKKFEMQLTQNNRNQRNFWWLFKKKKSQVRPGAMEPAAVKKLVEEIGIGKQIEIMRIGYDGSIDERPINVEIINTFSDGFTGKVVNVERDMIERSTSKLVYAKQGGGVMEFLYSDGDIQEIIIPEDEKLITQERNINGLKEILNALEKGDHIVSYYDSRERGTINAEGTLLSKDESGLLFSMKIEKVNRIELEKKIDKDFNIEDDLVIDIGLV